MRAALAALVVLGAACGGDGAAHEVLSCNMFPTLDVGDEVEIEEPPSEIERGDIVYANVPRERPGVDDTILVVSRAVGMPGDRLEADDEGRVLVDGEPLDEPYASGETLHLPAQDVPEGSYFLLGDNREDSADSRVYGPVEREAIEARGTGVRAGGSDEESCAP